MARRIAPRWAVIPALHRYQAAEAIGHVEDWQHKAGQCVRVCVGPGQRGRSCPRVRVWVEGPGHGGRPRRGFVAPATLEPEAYAKLLHAYLADVLHRRLGMFTHVLAPFRV